MDLMTKRLELALKSVDLCIYDFNLNNADVAVDPVK